MKNAVAIFFSIYYIWSFELSWADNNSVILYSDIQYIQLLDEYVTNNPDNIDGRLAKCLINGDCYWEDVKSKQNLLKVLYYYQAQSLYRRFIETNIQEYLSNSIEKIEKVVTLDSENGFPKYFLSFLYQASNNEALANNILTSAFQCKTFSTYEGEGCLLFTKFISINHLVNEANIGYFIGGYGNLSIEHRFFDYLVNAMEAYALGNDIDGQKLAIENLCNLAYANEFIIDWVEVHTMIRIINSLKPFKSKPYFPEACYNHIKQVTLPTIKKAIEDPRNPSDEFESFEAVNIAWNDYKRSGDAEILKNTKFWKDILLIQAKLVQSE